MLEKLMPKSDEFFDDFDAQCAVTVEGARMLHSLLSDYRDVAARVQALKEVEHKGDEVTHTAFNRLHKQFITPFDRTQIHSLLSRIDDVLDLTNAAAARLHYYEIPSSLPDAVELARVLVLCTEKVRDVVAALRLIKRPDQILAGCKEIKKLESQADEALRSGMGRLFKSGVDTLTIIKWKEIYDLIETATDKCNDVANVIEGVVLEHS
jgi:predicted phosphate transport protein (TIGR00153 family)